MSTRLALLVAAALLTSACTIRGRGRGPWPVAAGGSATDFDRSPSGASCCADTASPAGGWDTIGVANTDGTSRQPRIVERIEPITPGPDRALLAGPPQIGRLISDPDTIRALKAALKERGYYGGPVDGSASPALTDAIGRFQTDRKLPATGRLDGPTASALGVSLPPAPLPPRGG